MTPQRMEQIREMVGWSSRTLATRFGYGPTAGYEWEKGRAAIPPEVADWLEKIAKWWAKNPPPQLGREISR